MLDVAAVSAIFGFQWCSPCFLKIFLLQTAAPRHHAGWIDKAFRESSGQSDDDSTGPNFMCPCLLHPFTRLRLTGTVLRCAGSGWLFEAIWQGWQRCLVQGRIARSDARRGVWFVEFRWDGPSWSTFGRNSEGTRMTRKICWFFGCSGVPATSRKRVPGAPGGSCAEATWNLQISQANKLKKNVFHLFFFHVSSSSEIQTLKSTAFSLVHL